MPAAVPRALRAQRPRQVDRAVARYVRRSVYAYSGYYRDVLDRSGIGSRGIRGRADLAKLEPTELELVDEPGELVLRPDRESIRRWGSRWLLARLVLAQLLGRSVRFNRLVFEPRFKPIHWLSVAGLGVGYTTDDLLRLGELGAGWLTQAGVGQDDVVVSLLAEGSSVAHWQLVQGARRAQVVAAHLGPVEPTALVALAPSVLVGNAAGLPAVLEGVRDAGLVLANVRTILCVADADGPSGPALAHLAAAAVRADVICAWAPPPARAAWTECRAGARWAREQGVVAPFHAWDSAEVIEVESGALLWTGVGWSGSALLRVRTGARAGLETGRCPHCGVVGTRVLAAAGAPVNATGDLGDVATSRPWAVGRS